MMTSKKILIIVGVCAFAYLQAPYADDDQLEYYRSVEKIKSNDGEVYVINEYVENYLNSNKHKLYEVNSLRAQAQLLKEIQKNNKSIKDKTMILKGFITDKCWRVSNILACKFSVPVSGVSFEDKKPPNNIKEYLKTLNLFDGISVVDFNKRRYVVSLSTDKANNLSSMEKLKLMTSTRLLAKNNLLKFSKGEDIFYDFSYLKKIDKNLMSSEIKSKVVNILNKLLKQKTAARDKDFNYMWQMLNDSMLSHYAYIEIPKD